MQDHLDIRQTVECTCTRLRRTARRATALYDKWIGAAGLSVSQFTLLVILSFKDGAPIGTLAARADLDPTTLNRNLKPMVTRKLVRIARSAEDGRVRAVFITGAGRAKIREALPLWRRAQDELRATCGPEPTQALNRLLDGAYAALPRASSAMR